MMGNLKPYPVYKKSGVEWLGEVPAHWQVRWLKRIARLNPSKSEVPLALRDGRAVFLPMERVGSDGRFDASEVRPISDLWNGFTYFRQGDVIVAKITPCFENGKGACLENLPTALGFGSTEFHVIRPSKAVISAYLYRVTTLSEFRRLGADEMTGAAGQQRVPIEFIANFAIPIPPLPEQTAIARFLDYMDQRIRRVIRARQRRIKLIEEQIIAITAAAMCHPSCRYERLCSVATQKLRPVIRENETFYTALGLYNRGRGLFHKAPILGSDLGDSNFFWVEPDDLVLSGQFAWEGAVALAGPSEKNTVVSHRYYLLRGIDGWATTPYLWALLRSDFGEMLLNHHSRGGAGRNRPLNLNKLMKEDVPVPPLEEQLRIDELLRAIIPVRSTVEREIFLLREYRTRLISDVVTGKVDVREMAAQLPEEPPEEAELEGTEEIAESEAADDEVVAETFSEEEVEP